MNDKITFDAVHYSLNQIKKDYFLNDLCVRNSPQLENIAITIQSLYLYRNILMADEYPRSLEASLCKNIIISSYSVIEGIVIFAGYKIQTACSQCKHPCHNRSVSMFEDKSTAKNERNAFFNAEQFLKNVGIISFNRGANKFYNSFRDSRNNVHLGKTTEVITNDKNYTRKSCNFALSFLQEFIKLMKDNYKEFCRCNDCEVR